MSAHVWPCAWCVAAFEVKDSTTKPVREGVTEHEWKRHGGTAPPKRGRERV